MMAFDADAKYEKQLMDESISETLENSAAKNRSDDGKMTTCRIVCIR